MIYFFDTEFIEDGKTIDLLSIGIVSEDGRELYLENAEADLTKASPWVREHVFPHMRWANMVSRADIAAAINAMVESDPKPTFWAYFADYDWVAFCQLYGRMVDLPEKFPKFCMDFQQWLFANNARDKLEPAPKTHNALDDANWLMDQFTKLWPLYPVTSIRRG